jgi:hypothetical protein
MISSRQRAARKAARTKAANQAMFKRWREIEQPATRRVTGLLNHLLKAHGIVHLLWNPLNDSLGKSKLKNGVEYGTLVKFLNGGRLLRVLPEGYKQPQDYHPAYWEPLL